MQVIVQCRDAFDIDVSLRELFKLPTLDPFSAEIDRRIDLAEVRTAFAAAR